jgi:WD40 repeat protein
MQLEEVSISNFKQMKLYNCSNKGLLSLHAQIKPKLNSNFITYRVNDYSNNHIFVSTDKTIKLYKFTEDSFVLINTFVGHSRSVNCLEVSKNQTLISGSGDCSIKVWRIDDGSCITTLLGHEGSVYCVSLIKTSGYLISTSYDDSMKIWDIDLRVCIRTLENLTCGYLCVSRSLYNGHLFFGTNASTIQIWDIDHEKNVLIKTLAGHDGFVTVLEVLKEKVISGGKDFTIKVWDISTGKCEKTLRSHTGIVTLLKSLSEIELASSGEDRAIKIWDMEKFVCLKTIPISDLIGCLEITPTGQLVSCSSNYFKIWMLQNMEKHKKFTFSPQHVYSKCITKVFYL